MHRAGMPAVDVSVIRTKCRNFKLKVVHEHDDHAEMSANCMCAWKNFLDCLRCGAGSDVIILWCDDAHDVAYTPAGEVRGVAALTETRGNFARGLFHGRFHRGRGGSPNHLLSCEHGRLRSIAPTYVLVGEGCFCFWNE